MLTGLKPIHDSFANPGLKAGVTIEIGRRAVYPEFASRKKKDRVAPRFYCSIGLKPIDDSFNNPGLKAGAITAILMDFSPARPLPGLYLFRPAVLVSLR